MLEIRVVYWVDSTGPNGWRPIEELAAMTPDPVVSVGYVLADDDTRVVLCGSITERRDALSLQSGEGGMVIPRVSIVEEMTIRKGD